MRRQHHRNSQVSSVLRAYRVPSSVESTALEPHRCRLSRLRAIARQVNELEQLKQKIPVTCLLFLSAERSTNEAVHNVYWKYFRRRQYAYGKPIKKR